MSYKTYENYKDYGIEYIGEIPAHWDIKPLKYLANTIPGGTPSTNKLEYWENGNIPWLPSGMVQNCVINEDDVDKFITLEGLMNSATKYIGPNSVLIALTGATCANIALLPFKATANQSVISIEPYNFLPKFLYYYLLSQREQILLNKTGGAQSGINEDNVKNISVVSLSLFEQEKIVHFLDKKTSSIDENIAKNKELISLLEEKKVTLINQVVTKGLDNNVRMKDSGIEWIGEIPEHWETVKLKYCTNMINDKKDFADSKDKFVGLEHIESKTGKLIGFSNGGADGIVNKFKGNMILFGKLRPYLSKVALPSFDGVCSTEILVFQTKKQILPKFLFYILLSNKFIEHINSSTYGVKMPRASPDFINNTSIMIPPLYNQEMIINFLDGETSKIDNTIKKIEENIHLLEEYKASLIYHVVTGKIDVRDEV